MHMISAANMCIPRKWRSPDPPTIKDWFIQIQKIAEMEDLIHQARDSPSKFIHLWSSWLQFTKTDTYLKILQ